MNYHALFALFMGSFEVFICAGVNTGWPAIIKLLQQEEYFSSECEDAEPCLLQSQKFNLVYTILTSVGGATALLGWWVLKNNGVLKTRTFMITLMCSGFFIVSMSSKNNPLMLYFGFPLIEAGGFGLLMANIELCNFFDKHKHVLRSFVFGSYVSSGMVYMIVNYVYTTYKVKFKHIFLFFTVVSFSFNLNTFTQRSLHKSSKDSSEGCCFNFQKISKTKNSNSNANLVVDLNAHKVHKASKPQKLKECLNFYFLNHIFYNGFLSFAFNFFVGVFTQLASKRVKNVDSAVYFFCILLVTISVFAPLNGMLIKQIQSLYESKKCIRSVSTLKATAWNSLITSILASALFTCLLFENVESTYAAVVLLVLGWSCLSTNAAYFIGNQYPEENFDLLFNITTGVSAMFLAFQYPIVLVTSWYFNQSFYYIFFGLVVISLTSLAFPLSLFVKARMLSVNDENARLLGMFTW